jgi:outer membrane lipoprotein-sorting protein
MKNKSALITLVFAAFAFAAPISADEELTVDQIVEKANHAAYYFGSDGKSTVEMTITDKQGRERSRRFNILRMNVGQGDGDQKYFVYFQAPSDVRKMVYLVHKHVELDQDDDRWMYLPSLDLVKRIAAGDKRTSFVGSDYLYEDVSGRSLEADKHELTETTDDSYVVKNTPKKPELVEFSYYNTIIDKKTFLPVKMEFYDKSGELYRTIEALKIEMIKAKKDGKDVEYPTPTESLVKDIKSGSTTRMIFSNVQYNIGLNESIFTERYLRRPPREAMR